MREISLTQGQKTLVDDADYEELSKYKWQARLRPTGNYYAFRAYKDKTGHLKNISMHRQILGLKSGDKRETDHRNHNTLDNSRDNIRICTHQQNNFNRVPKVGTSGYKGVSWCGRTKKWMAKIHYNQKSIFLGRFRLEELAALAYDFAALKYFREFATFNF